MMEYGIWMDVVIMVQLVGCLFGWFGFGGCGCCCVASTFAFAEFDSMGWEIYIHENRNYVTNKNSGGSGSKVRSIHNIPEKRIIPAA